MANPALNINIKASDADAHRALGRLQKDVEKVGGQMDKTRKSTLSLGDAITGAAIAYGMKEAVEAASNLEESQSKVAQVFGDSADAVQAFGEDAAQSIGQSEAQALEAVGTFGNLLQAFGLTAEQAQGMSIEMTKLASDLASFNNTSVQDAIDALRSGLSGESEPLKRYGVAINDARLKAEAMAMGIYDGVGALDAATKAQATYALVMQDTAKAQGDFERTSDQTANKVRIAQAEFENAKAALGESLLPTVAAGAETVAALAQGFADLPKPVRDGVLAFAAMEAAAVKLGVGLQAIPWAAAVAGAIEVSQALADATNPATDLTTVLSDTADVVVDKMAEVEAASAKFNRNFYLDVPITELYKMRDALEATGGSSQMLDDAIAETERATREAANTSARYSGEVAALSEADAAAAGVVAEGNDAYERRADALKEINDEAERAIDLALGNVTAQADYEDAVQGTEEANRELNEARESGDQEAIEEAERKLERAIIKQAEAAVKLGKNTAELEGRQFDAADAAVIHREEIQKATEKTGYYNDELRETIWLLAEVERRHKAAQQAARENPDGSRPGGRDPYADPGDDGVAGNSVSAPATPGGKVTAPSGTGGATGNGIYVENMKVGGIDGVAQLEMALSARDHAQAQETMIGG